MIWALSGGLWTPSNRVLHSPVIACCCGGITCAGCTGGAASPTTVQVVIAGVTLCSAGCVPYGGSTAPTLNSFDVTHEGAINDTYCCTYNASLSTATKCVYTATLSDPMTLNGYTSTDCSGSPTAITIDRLEVQFDSAGVNKRSIHVNSSAIVDTINHYWTFRYVSTATPNCVDGTYSGLFSECVQSGFTLNFGYGGSATITQDGC